MLPIIGAVAVGALAGALIKSVADELNKDEYEAKIADLESQVADLKSELGEDEDEDEDEDDEDTDLSVEEIVNAGFKGMQQAFALINKDSNEKA